MCLMIACRAAALLGSWRAPSTKRSATGPHRFGVLAQLVGRAEGVTGAGDEQAWHIDPAEVLGAQTFWPFGRVQRVAEQHQTGCRCALRDRHRAHPAAERPAAEQQGAGRDAQLGLDLRKFLDEFLGDAVGSGRRAPTGPPVGEVVSADQQAVSQRCFDLDERAMIGAPAGTRRQQQCFGGDWHGLLISRLRSQTRPCVRRSASHR